MLQRRYISASNPSESLARIDILAVVGVSYLHGVVIPIECVERSYHLAGATVSDISNVPTRNRMPSVKEQLVASAAFPNPVL